MLQMNLSCYTLWSTIKVVVLATVGARNRQFVFLDCVDEHKSIQLFEIKSSQNVDLQDVMIVVLQFMWSKNRVAQIGTEQFIIGKLCNHVRIRRTREMLRVNTSEIML